MPTRLADACAWWRSSILVMPTRCRHSGSGWRSLRTGSRTEARPGFSPPISSHARRAGIDHGGEHDEGSDGGALARHRARELLRRRGRVRWRGTAYLADHRPARLVRGAIHAAAVRDVHVSLARERGAAARGWAGRRAHRRAIGSAPLGDDYTFLLKAPRAGPQAQLALEVNGQVNPDTIVFRVGTPTRLRFISLAAFNPNATFWLTTRPDSVRSRTGRTHSSCNGGPWPRTARICRRVGAGASSGAGRSSSMGETYDFEYTPTTTRPDANRGTREAVLRARPAGQGPGSRPVAR